MIKETTDTIKIICNKQFEFNVRQKHISVESLTITIIKSAVKLYIHK